MLLAQHYPTLTAAKKVAASLGDIDADWNRATPSEIVAHSGAFPDAMAMMQEIEQVAGTGYYTPTSE